ncbi:MAG TPA: hypothetical protein VF630_07435 [Hymenobacter sp.]|jgi:hypothetical protein
MDLILETDADVARLLHRPKLPDHALPPFEPCNPLEIALEQAASGKSGRVALLQALLLEPLYVPVCSLPGGALAGLRAGREGHGIFGRQQDHKVLLFSSSKRPYDGLPAWPWPLRERGVPLISGPSSLVLTDLPNLSFVLNPFSRHARAVPAHEVKALLAGRLVPVPTAPLDRPEPNYPLRALPGLPPGFADEFCAYCRAQPSLLRAYAAERALPGSDPAAAVVIVLLGLDPDRLVLHPLLPMLARYFRSIHKKTRVIRLPALPEHVHDDDQFVLREIGFLAPLYQVGGLSLPAWGNGPATD